MSNELKELEARIRSYRDQHAKVCDDRCRVEKELAASYAQNAALSAMIEHMRSQCDKAADDRLSSERDQARVGWDEAITRRKEAESAMIQMRDNMIAANAANNEAYAKISRLEQDLKTVTQTKDIALQTIAELKAQIASGNISHPEPQTEYLPPKVIDQKTVDSNLLATTVDQIPESMKKGIRNREITPLAGGMTIWDEVIVSDPIKLGYTLSRMVCAGEVRWRLKKSGVHVAYFDAFDLNEVDCSVSWDHPLIVAKIKETEAGF